MPPTSQNVIIPVEELKAHLNDPNWIILDARFDIDSEHQAKLNFKKDHIPGARQADLAEHMSGDVIAGKTPRRPLPDRQVFANQIRKWGINNDSTVVIYDDMNGIMAASRLWVMLKWAGHDQVALLDGGYTAWRHAGGPVSNGEDQPSIMDDGNFESHFRSDLICSLEEVDVFRSDPQWKVFDSRSLNDGIPSHDPVRGRIAGSLAADRALNSGPNRTWRPSGELRQHYERLLAGTDPSKVIFYCGSGVTAAQNLVGMAHAGIQGARLYVGSFSEWILDPRRPIDEVDIGT